MPHSSILNPITPEGQAAQLTIEHDRNLTIITVAMPGYPFRNLSFTITNHAVATNDPEDIFIDPPSPDIHGNPVHLTLASARLYAAALTEALAQASALARPPAAPATAQRGKLTKAQRALLEDLASQDDSELMIVGRGAQINRKTYSFGVNLKVAKNVIATPYVEYNADKRAYVLSAAGKRALAGNVSSKYGVCNHDVH